MAYTRDKDSQPGPSKYSPESFLDSFINTFTPVPETELDTTGQPSVWSLVTGQVDTKPEPISSPDHLQGNPHHSHHHPDEIPAAQSGAKLETTNHMVDTPQSRNSFSLPPLPAPALEPQQQHGIVPQVHNVVGTINLGCSLNLKAIASMARNAEYNPKRFGAVIMRIKDPRTTGLIFNNGKLVCTGAKSEAECRLASRKHARIIQKLGYPAKFTKFQIHNIVSSTDVKFSIRLEGLAHQHPRYASYEPELFPGLVFRMVHPKVAVLIFVSGKIVITGAKSLTDVTEAFDNIYPVVLNFKKKQTRS